MLASPHPLDCDWRFDRVTIEALCGLLAKSGTILSLGAPSIAQSLERLGCDVTLIDRQPDRDVSKHLAADIDQLVDPMLGFTTAIVDPPWYFDQFLHWATYAASCVGVGGTVLTSAWPAWTRPEAEKELETAITLMSEWAHIQRQPITLLYELPRFERLAIEASQGGPLSISPRKGILLSISVRQSPPPPVPIRRREIWQRFVVDEYQLALRLTGTHAALPRLLPHPEAFGWRWPFVGARAPGRSMIDLWSSDNEVACVQSAGVVVSYLRRALTSSGAEDFKEALEPLPDLLSWSIPCPPYRRLIEWQHRQ